MREDVSVILQSRLDQATAFADLQARALECSGHIREIHEDNTHGSLWFRALFPTGQGLGFSLEETRYDRRSVTISVRSLLKGSLVNISPTYSFMTPHDAITFQEIALTLLKVIEHEAGFSFTSAVEDIRESLQTPHVLRLSIERADLITIQSEFIVDFDEYDSLFAWQFGAGTETFWGPYGLSGLNPAERDPLPNMPTGSRVTDTALHAHLIKVNDAFFGVTRDVREALYEVCSARILP